MDTLISYFQIFTDETRLRMMVALSVRPLCVCELTELLNEPQPKISKHLAKLKDLGFVEGRRYEKYVLYRLSIHGTVEKALFATLLDQLDHYRDLKKLVHDTVNKVPIQTTITHRAEAKVARGTVAE